MGGNADAIREAFAKIKQDMDKHSKHISKISSKSKSLEKLMAEVKKDLSDLKQGLEKLEKQRILKDKSYKREIKRLVMEAVGEAKRPSLKAKIIQRFDRNKKQILTKKILDTIAGKELTLPELKTKVVDELRYCSKASFYRYFKELKREKLIDFIELDGARILVLVKQKPGLR
jgi:septal ring factor EnvC (AmiA/AmiB activator)